MTRVVLLLAAGASWETRALRALSGRRDLVVLKRCVDVDDLLAAAAARQADTAVVAIEAPGLDLDAVDHLRHHGVRPIAVVTDEPGSVRAARIGIATTLPADSVEELPDAVTSDPGPVPGSPRDRPVEETAVEGARGGRVVAVWGPAGAPGRTTLATALASAVGARARTTLVDADPYGGTVAQVLGVLDEVSGLLAAARLAGSGRLEDEVAGVQLALGGRLTVVTGLPRPDRWTEVRAGTVELLAETLSRQGHVVLDTGFGLDDDDLSGRPGRNRLTLGALDVADEVVVVGTADPVGLSRLARALVDLRELHPRKPTRVVVNRMRPTIGWSEREVGQVLAEFARPTALHFLPEDRSTVDRALVAGRSLLETSTDSPLVTAIDQLAGALVPGARPEPRTRRLRPRTTGTTRPR